MAQGSQSKLRQELDAMLRQRDQYSLALDTATDPQAAIRLQRTLDRLEDEIEGLQEALKAMPAAADPPDWEDEPATAIFDPDEMLPPEPPAAPPPAPAPPSAPAAAVSVDEDLRTRPVEAVPEDFRRPSEVPTDVGPRALGDPPTEQKPSQIVTVPGAPNPLAPDDRVPEPSEPAAPATSTWRQVSTEVAPVAPTPEPGAAQQFVGPDPTVAVTAPVDPMAEVDPSTQPMRRPQPAALATSAPAPAPAPEQPAPPAVALRESSRALPDPLGPVVLDALEPPTGEIPKEGAAPVSPLDSAAGQQQVGTEVDDSPFGSTTAGAVFDVSSDPAPEESWSGAGKILLALVVAAFLAGVFWVLSQ